MPEYKKGQLNLNDRIYIEDSIRRSQSISSIAKRLGVDRTTIAREIKRNRVDESPNYMKQKGRNICLVKSSCHVREACKNGCIMPCRTCKKGICNAVCTEFKPNECRWLLRPPFVCNDCRKRYGFGCEYQYFFYDARLAHERAEQRKTEARKGIDRTEDELEQIVSIVKPLLKKGQGLEHIWATHADELPCTIRTFYNYVASGSVDIINLELPKKVAYKPRRKKVVATPRHDMTGRTYEDFLKLDPELQMSAVEMDCVEGLRADKKTILTLLFRRYSFQIMMLLPEKTNREVDKALDSIEKLC